MRKPINLYELLWAGFFFLTITDFTWVYLIITVLTCPIWVVLYDNGKAYQASQETLEELKIDENGQDKKPTR